MSILSVENSISNWRAPEHRPQSLSLVTAERDADGRYPVLAVWVLKCGDRTTALTVHHGYVERHELAELEEYRRAAITNEFVIRASGVNYGAD